MGALSLAKITILALEVVGCFVGVGEVEVSGDLADECIVLELLEGLIIQDGPSALLSKVVKVRGRFKKYCKESMRRAATGRTGTQQYGLIDALLLFLGEPGLPLASLHTNLGMKPAALMTYRSPSWSCAAPAQTGVFRIRFTPSTSVSQRSRRRVSTTPQN